MTGVNELADEWRETASRHELNNPHGLALDASARRDCASDLDGIREEVWKPSSDPPTEADSNDSKHVMCVMADGSVQSINYALVCEYGMAIGPWARILDVVLLPPTATGRGS